MKEAVIMESAKYGMAIVVLVLCLIGTSYAIKVMWDHSKDTQKEMMRIINENTVAFQQLHHSISMLISILNK